MSAFVPPDPLDMQVPPVESPFLERHLADSGASAELAETARAFARDGYAVLDLADEAFEQRADRIVADLAPRYPSDDRRLAEAWYWQDDVRAVAADPRVLDLLRQLYQREPFPFQTLNFDRGTEQHAHSDTLHFSCRPHGFMVGVWVAFEDMDEANGTLFVHPGSHRLPEYDMHDLGLASRAGDYQAYEELVSALLDAAGFPPKPLPLRRGQAAVWAANLFHGGTPIGDPRRTRHSQATHYYFEDCLYYQPLESDPILGQLCLREVINMLTGEVVPHRYRGAVLELTDYHHVWSYPRPLPDWITRVRPEHLPDSDGGSDDLSVNLRTRLRALAETVEALRDENKLKEQHIARLESQLQRIWDSRTHRMGRALKGALGLRPRA